MSSRKIHLDLFDITGPSWKDVNDEAINRLEQVIRELPVLGKEPEQFAVTGITRFDNVIAGYLVVQFERETLQYDRTKQETKSNRPEWEKTVFAIFPEIGKLLFQSQQYPKGLTRDRVFELFKTTIKEFMLSSRLSNTTFITPISQEEIPDDQFIQVFDNPSNRVDKIVVENLRANLSLEELTYYNPQIERNRIIGQSLSHDFGMLDKIQMEAEHNRPDLRSVHIAKAAVRSGKNNEMYYTSDSGEKHVLRRKVRENYELTVDMDLNPMRVEDVQKMAEQVLEQYGLYRKPNIPNALPDQTTIFDLLGEG